ncbi:MAG: hypothetical protein QNJ97_18075 [Myxococcota bacterium]|nr:hypothetical protein [Myxococcota bacterium]
MEVDFSTFVFQLWIKAFVFTLMIEIPIFVFVARLDNRGKDCPIWRLCLAGAVGTCVTHPLLWFAWPVVLDELARITGMAWISDYRTYIVCGELFAVFIEVYSFFKIVRTIRLSNAIAASFIANAASFGLGALLKGQGWMV